MHQYKNSFIEDCILQTTQTRGVRKNILSSYATPTAVETTRHDYLLREQVVCPVSLCSEELECTARTVSTIIIKLTEENICTTNTLNSDMKHCESEKKCVHRSTHFVHHSNKRCQKKTISSYSPRNRKVILQTSELARSPIIRQLLEELADVSKATFC